MTFSLQEKNNNKKKKLNEVTICDAPSMIFVNITIDFSLSSHIIRQKSSHVSGLGPIEIHKLCSLV
jgi:hypothetical protein